MDMRVSFQFLTPTVQHDEKADFRAETFGITSDFQKGFRTGRKQEIVEDLLVLQHQRGQMTGKREDHMDVASREQFLATCCNPTVAGSGLTLWAMATYGSCYTGSEHDVRSECTHRDARRARPYDTAQWPAAL